MKTERQSEQPISSDEGVRPEDAVLKPAAHPVAYKTVLAATVIGIVTISALWMSVIRQEGSPVEVPAAEPDVQVPEGTAVIALPTAKSDPALDSVSRRLVSLSGSIDRGFETQKTHSSFMKRKISAIAQGIQTINSTLADLGESNKELARRINEASKRLHVFTKEVRALKAVKHKPAVKQKLRPVKSPPFQIDAIDIWDDLTYVAVSQAGRVAFLKAGEKQSGWTITHIDRLKGQVDFQGPAGQVHSVSLRR